MGLTVVRETWSLTAQIITARRSEEDRIYVVNRYFAQTHRRFRTRFPDATPSVGGGGWTRRSCKERFYTINNKYRRLQSPVKLYNSFCNSVLYSQIFEPRYPLAAAAFFLECGTPSQQYVQIAGAERLIGKLRLRAINRKSHLENGRK